MRRSSLFTDEALILLIIYNTILSRDANISKWDVALECYKHGLGSFVKVYRKMKKLEKEGLISLHPEGKFPFRHFVRLTEKGKGIVHKLHEIASELGIDG